MYFDRNISENKDSTKNLRAVRGCSMTMWTRRGTPSNSEIICGRNVGTKVVGGIIFFIEKKAMLKI